MGNTIVKSQKNVEMDDIEEEIILLEASATAAVKAIQESKSFNLTVHVIRGNEIIAIKPDDSTEVVKVIPKRTVITGKMRKGAILKRK